jgi:flagellar biosynthesis protein FlhA
VQEIPAELLSYAGTQKLLDELPREQQKLVSDLIPSQMTTGGIQRVLQALLAERVDPAEAADLASAYSAAGASLLVGTRLDLSCRLGGILAAAAVARLALTEAGVGPNAADGLLPITPAWLARRLLAHPRMESRQ